jgi:hypothetical protein
LTSVEGWDLLHSQPLLNIRPKSACKTDGAQDVLIEVPHLGATSHPLGSSVQVLDDNRDLLHAKPDSLRTVRRRHAELSANAENKAPALSSKVQLVSQLRIGDVIAPALTSLPRK